MRPFGIIELVRTGRIAMGPPMARNDATGPQVSKPVQPVNAEPAASGGRSRARGACHRSSPQSQSPTPQ